MDRIYKASEAARELGKSVQWLRFAEAKGKIPKPRRDLNNWRLYTQEDIDEIRGMVLPNRLDG